MINNLFRFYNTIFDHVTVNSNFISGLSMI